MFSRIQSFHAVTANETIANMSTIYTEIDEVNFFQPELFTVQQDQAFQDMNSEINENCSEKNSGNNHLKWFNHLLTLKCSAAKIAANKIKMILFF